MLVTFSTSAYADITMFGDVALRLLKLMGHSATVPGAMRQETRGQTRKLFFDSQGANHGS